uniref:SFRICE_009639 n=1 Tax=Spodoptera frugiperda TaxID=7108 RepID=A0A2H1VBV9_SPOFR
MIFYNKENNVTPFIPERVSEGAHYGTSGNEQTNHLMVSNHRRPRSLETPGSALLAFWGKELKGGCGIGDWEEGLCPRL